MKSKRALTTIIAIVVVTASGCGDSRISGLRSDFVAGCKSSGVSKDACACTFDKIEENYTIDQLMDMKIGVFPKGFEEFEAKSVLQCVREN